MISSTTVLPALSSFCVYAALGVLALYILQVTNEADASDRLIAGVVSFAVCSQSGVLEVALGRLCVISDSLDDQSLLCLFSCP